ncbi:MAG: porin family protein [Maritimibacter sp.]|nr:porin family protein [Maritimibacter sp.]
MKTTLLAAVIAGLAGSAAFAGSPEPYIEHVYTEPPALDAEWDGFYAGLIGGIQNGEVTPGPFDFDGVSYGGFAGYNFQTGNTVFGAEIAAQRGTLDFAPPSLTMDMLVDAKVRVGYSMGDALLFASGGYSTAGTTIGFAAKGWNAGAGLDFAVTDKVFVGAEYVYRSMPTTVPAGFDVTSHAGQLRAGLKF